MKKLICQLCLLLLPGVIGASESGAAEVGATEDSASAVFAGGCFWCVEAAFDPVDGVTETTSGFSGGHVENPTYKAVSAGGTGHLEVVRVTYDPRRVTYAQLLDVFWRNIDPFDDGGQFCDRGESYRAAIFYGDAAEQQLAEASKAAHAQALGRDIVTRVLPAQPFYPAENYHQNYYRKNPVRYKYYRFSCGRDRRLEAVWGSSDH
jgi:peptide-methionine (S)-S-oxide reductase